MLKPVCVRPSVCAQVCIKPYCRNAVVICILLYTKSCTCIIRTRGFAMRRRGSVENLQGSPPALILRLEHSCGASGDAVRVSHRVWSRPTIPAYLDIVGQQVRIVL